MLDVSTVDLVELVKVNIQMLWAVVICLVINISVLMPICIREMVQVYQQWRNKHLLQ